MSSRRIITFIVIILASAGTYFYKEYQKKQETKQVQEKNDSLVINLNAPIIEELYSNEVSTIFIRNSEGTITLKQEEGFWLLEEQDDFLADTQKVVELFENFLTIQVSALVSRNEKKFVEFELAGPQDTKFDATSGTLVRFTFNDENSVSFLLGKKKFDKGSQYIRKINESDIFLINGIINLPTGIDNWINKEILMVDVEDVSSVYYESQNEKFSFNRENKEKSFNLEDIQENEKIKKEEVDKLINNISSLNFLELIPREEAQEKKEFSFKIGLIDGTQITQNFIPLAQPKGEEKKYAILFEAHTEREILDKINDYSKIFAFVVSEQQIKELVKKRSDFIGIK